MEWDARTKPSNSSAMLRLCCAFNRGCQDPRKQVEVFKGGALPLGALSLTVLFSTCIYNKYKPSVVTVSDFRPPQTSKSTLAATYDQQPQRAMGRRRCALEDINNFESRTGLTIHDLEEQIGRIADNLDRQEALQAERAYEDFLTRSRWLLPIQVARSTLSGALVPA